MGETITHTIVRVTVHITQVILDRITDSTIMVMVTDTMPTTTGRVTMGRNMLVDRITMLRRVNTLALLITVLITVVGGRALLGMLAEQVIRELEEPQGLQASAVRAEQQHQRNHREERVNAAVLEVEAVLL